MSDLSKYRASEQEAARTDDLLRLLPKGRQSVIDIGARDGHFSRLLTAYFPEVTALDLEEPTFEMPGVRTVAGDVTNLPFSANSFDCVFCAEVLEHIPDVGKACSEILRIAKSDLVIGVPFKQDRRLGRTRCSACRKVNPPWGHVNSFDESRLESLFAGAQVVHKSFVGSSSEASNSLAALLADMAGNPWGTYEQDERCIYCEATLIPSGNLSLWKRACAGLSVRLERMQTILTPPHGNWIHLALKKPG